MSTYTQIQIQAVFAVKYRETVIDKNWKERLYRYIISIIQESGHKVLAIGGIEDHVHIFFGFRPKQSLSSLMLEVKRDSSKWINQNGFVTGRFEWQSGYGAFSYSKSQIHNVVRYINNQEKHHAKRSFLEEYKKILDDLNIQYNEKYMLK